MRRTSDYDSPWKDILEVHFKEFMALFLPKAAADIDWSRKPVFLDKELQAIAPRGAAGRRIVDKLVGVTLNSGEDARVLVHVEVQASRRPDVPERMYIYNYRGFDRHKRKVASVLVLLDDQPSWRPGSFGYELWDTHVRIEYPVIKLLDWESRRGQLEKSTNPFATVVLAHLEVLRAGRKTGAMLESKWSLVRRLFKKGFSRGDVLALFRFIDGLITLPGDLEEEFRTRLHRHQEREHMPYVTSIERLARREGREEGREEGAVVALRAAILEVLEARFGKHSSTLPRALGGLTDSARLKELVRDAAQAGSSAEFEAKLVRHSAAGRVRRTRAAAARRR